MKIFSHTPVKNILYDRCQNDEIRPRCNIQEVNKFTKDQYAKIDRKRPPKKGGKNVGHLHPRKNNI